MKSKATKQARKSGARASSRGRLRLDDIANKVGVSTITVSRAFRTPNKVAPKLRDRILKTAQKMGYVISRAASSLASARSMNIAVIVPSLSNTVFVDILAGVEKVLRPKGYHLLLGVSNYSPEEEEALVRTYLAFDPDGILITGMNYREATRRLLDQVKTPVVHMMELSEKSGIHSVGFSQEAAAEAMIDHLLAQGRRKIAYVAAQLDPRALARHRGYRERLKRAGLHDPQRELLVPDKSSIALGGKLLARLLEQSPDTDAVFFCNDDLAQGALFECLRRKIAVPKTLAVAGFNDLPASACAVPSLTTIATPRFEVGVQSAAMLLDLIEGRSVARRKIDLGFELRPRQST
jgi:LacI family transcriptional regulator, gluconate utilization system Gnt-I transcriptional repressor